MNTKLQGERGTFQREKSFSEKHKKPKMREPLEQRNSAETVLPVKNTPLSQQLTAKSMANLSKKPSFGDEDNTLGNLKNATWNNSRLAKLEPRPPTTSNKDEDESLFEFFLKSSVGNEERKSAKISTGVIVQSQVQSIGNKEIQAIFEKQSLATTYTANSGNVSRNVSPLQPQQSSSNQKSLKDMFNTDPEAESEQFTTNKTYVGKEAMKDPKTTPVSLKAGFGKSENSNFYVNIPTSISKGTKPLNEVSSPIPNNEFGKEDKGATTKFPEKVQTIPGDLQENPVIPEKNCYTIPKVKPRQNLTLQKTSSSNLTPEIYASEKCPDSPKTLLRFGTGAPIENFTGRKKELDFLKAFIQGNSYNQLILTGFRGMGKTEIVKVFIQQNPQLSCAFLNGANRSFLIKDLLHLQLQLENQEDHFRERRNSKGTAKIPTTGAKMFKLSEQLGKNNQLAHSIENLKSPTTELKEEELTDILKRCCKQHANPLLLLIIDDITENFQELKKISKYVSQWKNPKLKLLITSPIQNLIKMEDKKVFLHVKPLLNEDAMQFIQNSIRPPPTRGEVQKISEQFQNYPLAIQQLIQYMKFNQSPVSEILNSIKFQDFILDGEYEKIIDMMVKAIKEYLAKQRIEGNIAAGILEVSSLLASNHPVSFEFLSNFYSEEFIQQQERKNQFQIAFGLLKKFYLAELTECNTLLVSPLTQRVVLRQIQKPGTATHPLEIRTSEIRQFEILHLMLSKICSQTIPHPSMSSPFAPQDVPHVLRLWDHWRSSPSLVNKYPSLPCVILRQFLKVVTPEESGKFARNAIKSLQNLLTDENIQFSAILQLNIAKMMLFQGSGTNDLSHEGLLITRQVYPWYAGRYGKSHPLTLDVERHMLYYLTLEKEFAEALSLASQMLKQVQESFGSWHEMIYMIKFAVGEIQMAQGRREDFAQAVCIFEEVREFQEEVYGLVQQNIYLKATLLNLLHCYERMDKFGEMKAVKQKIDKVYALEGDLAFHKIPWVLLWTKE